jgi:peptidoglycan hydrolase-like protein with peptidoglycan-binding domain
MTSSERQVIINIIYAVETGGQVYGNKDYASFTPAYYNTPNETSITIGAGQWMGIQAKNLLQRIRNSDSDLFTRMDTAGIGNDLDTANWSTYQTPKGSSKSICIQNIINTSVGHQCQDDMVGEQMEEYMTIAANLGVPYVDGQMMCANFIHQGGKAAAERVLNKTNQPYTLDNIYTAVQTDTVAGQVGTYKSRQDMVYNSIKQYVSSNSQITSEQAIETAISIAQDEIGYLEKSSNNDLDSKTGNAGNNNYTKYWRDIKPEWQRSAWCACFVTWVYVKAFGQETAKKLLKHYPYVYVPTLSSIFDNYSNPEVGDIVMFKNGGVFSHTGLVTSVNGDTFTTIDGNTGPGRGIESNGDGVYSKSYNNNNLSGTKFARPDYSLVGTINGSGGSTPSGNNPGESWVGTGTAICSGSEVNVRATPGGSVIGSLNKGNAFEVDGTQSGVWVHIRVAGIGIGYMHQDYVQYNFGEDNTDTTPGKVKAAQSALNNSFNAGLVVDGIWGAASSTAYVQALQKALNSVYGSRLDVDGIWGLATSTACSSILQTQGMHNTVVGVLQIGLYAHGISLVGGIDFSFGSSTYRGVVAFQSNVNLPADGIAGADTFSKLAGANNSSDSLSSWNKSATCSGNSVYVRTAPNGSPIGTLSKGAALKLDGTRVGSWIHVKTDIGIGYMHQNYVQTGSSSSGTSNTTVKLAQTALNNLFHASITVDGAWGLSSKLAYIKSIQKSLNTVYKLGLTEDGLWGENTANACENKLLKKGANNLYVGALQIGLSAHGISLANGIDRDFGNSTEYGLKLYQSKMGLSADGVAGKDVFTKLIQ